MFCRFAQLLRFAPALPIGRADARFQPVWIGDVVDAFLRALDDDTTIAGSYDLVGPEVMTLAEIVRLTASTKGWTRFVVSLPAVFGRMQAEVGEHLPGKPISRDNWRSLQRDSTSDDNGLPKLGIIPTDVRGKQHVLYGTPLVGAPWSCYTGTMLYVAMSRAKSLLVVVGTPATCAAIRA